MSNYVLDKRYDSIDHGQPILKRTKNFKSHANFNYE